MSRQLRFKRPFTASNQLANPAPVPSPQPPAPRSAFTLIEMLVAMAITLVMMAAVVTLFANVSNSVRNRRATIEMSGQLRHVRNVLQQDLLGATCPGLTWQRPDSNHGYIEIIEGKYHEGYASNLIDNIDDSATTKINLEIDHATSMVPASNLPFTKAAGQANWATDGGGLGDYDDILMLTVRNEHEPFVGRVPSSVRPNATAAASFTGWKSETIESPLAEVVWFAIENPAKDEDANRFFGEPGMRTIYRRTLLIAPWINPYRYIERDSNGNVKITDTFDDGATFKAEPGLVRLLPDTVKSADVASALAALVAFQDRYDLSVRVEWDPDLGRWKILANALADLTKRENRFGHFGHRPGANERLFPYPLISWGSGYTGSKSDVKFVMDPDPGFAKPTDEARAEAHIDGTQGNSVSCYTVDNLNFNDPHRRKYPVRPFAYVEDVPKNGTAATAQAILNDDGEVVRVVHGPVPLWGTRRGEDVMMTDALAFDLRVFDPGAPIFEYMVTETMLDPGDPGWVAAYVSTDNMAVNNKGQAKGVIGTGNTLNKPTFPYVGQGAFVDLGYGFDWNRPSPIALPTPAYHANFAASAAEAWFFKPRALSDVFGNQLAPGYAVYDTWSFHYENNGRNDDGDAIDKNGVWQQVDDGSGTPQIDEGTNGVDDMGHYPDGNFVRLGVDDVGERETAPPYDHPLRGVQVIMRAYERDSRAIRQVRVTQHFMPE